MTNEFMDIDEEIKAIKLRLDRIEHFVDNLTKILATGFTNMSK